MKKLIQFFIFFSLLFTDCYSYNLGELIDEIRVAVKDASSTSSNRRYSDAFLTTRINAIQEDICKETRCIQKRISTHTVAGQQEYNYPSDMIAPERVAYYIAGSTPPAYKKLEAVSIGGLDFEIPNWENVSAGLPTKYYERGQIYGLYPKPSSVYTSTYSVQIDYYANASSMSATTDIPFNGDVTLRAYHKLLIIGVVNLCRKDMGLPSDEILYYQLLQKMSDEIRTRKDFKGGHIQITPR